ncbi:MAG: type II toxin-antitoxin system HipA family toxin [Planctomycetes bacterium]|nr:type II toxin-antitoxin system HipA family toxin [Planctomycetota bacterium]MCB9886076.1 type II toxin-antitoxin system HipA family toxin [Planctomycetota bacterium]
MSALRRIDVFADWVGLDGARRVGELSAAPARGKEVFAFEYDDAWLAAQRFTLDPALQLYRGPQYPPTGRAQFGMFLDSAPDRWGRLLMRRREALRARDEGRDERPLLESDYLLGVHDSHRIGGLRYRVGDRFLDDDDRLASPPWTSLCELQHASLQLERDDVEQDAEYARWLRLLVSPGGSLGGARPKASVRDERDRLWIAKFPSRADREDVGAWEMVVRELAGAAGVAVPAARLERFTGRGAGASGYHTYLSRRFDRPDAGGRRHFVSAMTMTDRSDGTEGHDGASYLDLAEVLLQHGAKVADDLEQLWRRIVFYVCVSNTDDHLRNHGFLLEAAGFVLAPAYDINPNPDGDGLTLNVSENGNAQDLDLVLGVAPWFRLSAGRAREVAAEVVAAVRTWRRVAGEHGISKASQQRMARAFRIADA